MKKRILKKILAVGLSAVMLLALAGCSKGGDAPKAEENAASAEKEAAGTDSAAQITTITPGKLTVATSPDFAPYEFYYVGEGQKPELAGFDIALAQYIADYWKLELEIIPMDFDGVLTELATKNVDLGISGLSPDPARENAMDFSDIYYTSSQSFVTIKDKASELNSLEVANDPKYTIGAQTGSIQLDLANENVPNSNIISLPKVTDLVAEIVGGKMDGAFIETPVAESYMKNYPDLTIVCDVPYDESGSAIGVFKGNESLLKAVNEAIASAKADGSIENFVVEANEKAAGQYEGDLENGVIK